MTNPRTSFSVSIHGPGFGTNLTSEGKIPTMRYGSAMPVAIDAKTAYVTPVDCVSVNPKTGPRNGPLQGVARTVLSTPLRNEPVGPSCVCTLPAVEPINPGIGSSHTPRNDKAKLKTIADIVMLKPEEVNCSPHARLFPASPRFAATLAVARTKKTAYRPAQYQRLS